MSGRKAKIKRLQQYEVGNLIGKGGSGSVYAGTDKRLGRKVALKFLHPLADLETRTRFISEARAASSLDHRNICTVFQVEETPQGETFIVMPFYEGETLDVLIRKSSLDIGRCLAIAIQVAEGLTAAHNAGLVHGDVKPGNLMIQNDECVKILDFGLARRIGEKSAADEGFVAGTPRYMSPEQLRGESCDERSDIWSLGVVLYEMLTGQAPFQGLDLHAQVESVLRDGLIPPSSIRTQIPRQLESIIGSMLSRNPRRRYQRMEEVARELKRVATALEESSITLRFPAATVGHSLAVLPLEDLSGELGDVCVELAAAVAEALCKDTSLQVRPVGSDIKVPAEDSDLRQLGQLLNVKAVITGKVTLRGSKVRMELALIDVENGRRVWKEGFDRRLEEVREIEEGLAKRIAISVEDAVLGDPTLRGGFASVGDTEVVELYRQAREFFHQHRRRAFEIALQTFSQILEVSPDYAKAYAGIADCHSFLSLYFGESPTQADHASRKALEIDPNLAEAHASRGLAHFVHGNLSKAEQELSLAIQLAPELYDPHYVFGRVCFTEGRFAEAVTHFRNACARASDAYDSWYLLSMCYRRLEDTAGAEQAEVDCIAAVRWRVLHHPDDTRAWTMGAAVLAKQGERDKAGEWIEKALRIDSGEPIIEYNAACVYAGLSRFDDALRCLKASVGHAGISTAWVKNDPDLDALRNDPRYSDFLSNLEPMAATS